MAVILAITILGTGLIGSYTTVPAAEFSAGALAASETLEWITAALGAVGISISVKELLKPRQADIEKDIGKHIDWDNYDWGDALDSPAAQDQIDELDKTINRLYGNASAKWKEMYEKSLSPTPTPETSPDNPEPSPPVTVAPVDPDTVTPPDWETLKNMSRHNGFIPLEVGTFWCLKEAVKGFWDNLMEEDSKTNVVKNKYKDNTLLGYQSVTSVSGSNKETMTTYAYDINGNITKLRIKDSTQSGCSPYHNFYAFEKNALIGSYYIFNRSWTGNSSGTSSGTSVYNYSVWNTTNEEYHFYVPLVDSNGNVVKDAEVRPIGKTAIWPSTDLKNDYDNNKSPSLPDTAPAPAIKIPSLDDLKDLQKKGDDASDDDRPSIILDWLKDHYTNPSTDPNPKPDPDPNPNPDPKPDPDPNPDPKPDPDPNPDPDPDPKPTTAPKPDDTNTDVNPDDYKADLRLVFPFCIPFDLVHLIQAFEAEPEAPVFEFPFDLELENPWTGKKILDYHHVFKLDMSDYEPVIKIFRIFEIIFFIIGLLMITRQQMIKG